MIVPGATNIVGQRVVIVARGGSPTAVRYGRGIVRAVDLQHGIFTFLIEAVGSVDLFTDTDGGFFQVTTADETVEVIVDREAS